MKYNSLDVCSKLKSTSGLKFGQLWCQYPYLPPLVVSHMTSAVGHVIQGVYLLPLPPLPHC